MSTINTYYNSRIHPLTGVIESAHIISEDLSEDYQFIVVPSNLNAPAGFGQTPVRLEIELPETPDLSDPVNKPLKLYKGSLSGTLLTYSPTIPTTGDYYTLGNSQYNKSHVVILSPTLVNEHIYFDYYGIGTVLNANNFNNFNSMNVTHKNIILNEIFPIGSVIIWTRNTKPDNQYFFECNGDYIYSDEYPILSDILQQTYGLYTYDGDRKKFKLPDYRGFFLRGWDNGANRDLGKSSRGILPNGNNIAIGDVVGSEENNSNDEHSHSIPNLESSPAEIKYQHVENQSSVKVFPYMDSPTNLLWTNQSPSVASESRPINVNVMFCIRAK